MTEVVELQVDKAAWDARIPGWNVPVLQLSVVFRQLTIAGNVVSSERYEVDKSLGIVRWRGGSAPGGPLGVQLASQGTSSHDKRELASRWKKLAIVFPFLAAIVAVIITQALSTRAAAWSRLAEPEAYESFLQGGRMPVSLDGFWDVRLFEVDASGNIKVDASGNRIPYKVQAKNKAMIEYPPELVRCHMDGSLVFFSTKVSTGEGEPLWAEGRISQHLDVTLMSWLRAGTPGETLVSVNLLRLQKYQFNEPMVLGGLRIGISRDLKDLRISWIEYTKINQ